MRPVHGTLRAAQAEPPRALAFFDAYMQDSPQIADPQRTAEHLFLLLEGAFAHHRIYGGQLLSEARSIAEGILLP